MTANTFYLLINPVQAYSCQLMALEGYIGKSSCVKGRSNISLQKCAHFENGNGLSQ